MNDEDSMSIEDKTLMNRYGITSTPKMVYFYKQFRYENLTDAVRYAESDRAATPDQRTAPLAGNLS